MEQAHNGCVQAGPQHSVENRHTYGCQVHNILPWEGTKIPAIVLPPAAPHLASPGLPRRGCPRKRTHDRGQVLRPQLPLAELQGARGLFRACAQRFHVQMREFAVALARVLVQKVPVSSFRGKSSPWAVAADAASPGMKTPSSHYRPQAPRHGRSHLGQGTRSHAPFVPPMPRLDQLQSSFPANQALDGVRASRASNTVR